MIVTTAELARLVVLLHPFRDDPITKDVIDHALAIARQEVHS